MGQYGTPDLGPCSTPARRPVTTAPPSGCADAAFPGADVRLRGWLCTSAGPPRGTIVYLHGIADNRTSAAGIARRFTDRGFNVIAYDSRAHGESDGDACTYGFFEKQDLHAVLDTIKRQSIVLIGTSLGAAVALQEAAGDRRVSAVAAPETFSDLRTIASERAPFFFTQGLIRQAFLLAEAQAHFDVDAVSPRDAAAHITVPVLLIHGAAETETSPDHSRRAFAAMNGRGRLMIVPGAAHNESLRSDAVWQVIDEWIGGRR